MSVPECRNRGTVKDIKNHLHASIAGHQCDATPTCFDRFSMREDAEVWNQKGQFRASEDQVMNDQSPEEHLQKYRYGKV